MSISNSEFNELDRPVSPDNRLLILELCIDLLRSLNEDAHREFESLSLSVVTASQRVSALKVSASENEQDLVSAKINALLTQMQFSDRFCQRLDNTKQSLCCLHQVMSKTPNGLTNDESQSLLEQTRNIFTTEQERSLFDKNFGLTDHSPTNANQVSLSDNVLFFDEEEQSHE